MPLLRCLFRTIQRLISSPVSVFVLAFSSTSREPLRSATLVACVFVVVENSLHDCGNFAMIPPARNLSGNTHGECCSFAISLSHVPVLLQNGHRSSCSHIALTPSIRKRQILSQSLPTFLWQKTTCRRPQCFHLKHLL